MKIITWPTDKQIIVALQDFSARRLTGLAIDEVNQFGLYDSSSTIYIPGTYSTGVEYFVWLHYIKGTGVNATSELYFSETRLRPSSPTVSNYNASGLYDVNRFRAACIEVDQVVYDQVQVSVEELGDFPL